MSQREQEVVVSSGAPGGLIADVASETGGALGELEAIRARGYWELVWRRFRRDKAAIISGFFIILLIAVAFAGAPIAQRYIGHGPSDIFVEPPAVQLNSLLPANPGTWFNNPYKNNARQILLLGAANRLGQDEFLRLLYGARISLE